MVKKKKVVKKAVKKVKKSEAPLLGKVGHLLPAALDVSQLGGAAGGGGDDEEDDGAPEEVANVAPPATAVEDKRGRPKGRPKPGEEEGASGGGDDSNGPSGEAAGGPAFFWQDAGNKKLLATLQEEDAKTRERRRKVSGKVERDGVVLVDEAQWQAEDAPMDAADFLSKELFSNRKRTRNSKEKKDRNVLSAAGLGNHRTNHRTRAHHPF